MAFSRPFRTPVLRALIPRAAFVFSLAQGSVVSAFQAGEMLASEPKSGIVGGCLDPVEEVPELEEGGGVLEEAAAPPVSRGESPSLSGSNSKGNPTKLYREEGIVKDGRPTLPIYPTAAPVLGKASYCFNPFNNNILDVCGLPPGTLVLDPQDKIKGQKFRVPKYLKEEVAPEGESVVEDLPLEDQWGPEEENP